MTSGGSETQTQGIALDAERISTEMRSRCCWLWEVSDEAGARQCMNGAGISEI